MRWKKIAADSCLPFLIAVLLASVLVTPRDAGDPLSTTPRDAAGAISYWVAPPETKVTPTTTPPAGSPQQDATVFVARNEYEFFHVVVQGPLQGVDAALPPAFVGPAGVMPSTQVQVFREEFVRVTTPSPNFENEGGPRPLLPAGESYADGLVPLDDPYDSSNHPGRGFDVPSGEVRALLVKVQATPTQPAGLYHGNVTLTATGQTPTVVPVDVYVWDFALPNATLDAAYFVEEGYKTIHQLEGLSGPNDPLLATYRQRYYRLLADARLYPAELKPKPPFDPDAGTVDFSNYESLVDDLVSRGMRSLEVPSYFDGYTDEYPDGSTTANFNSAGFNASVLAYYRAWADWLAGKGLLERSYAFVADETGHVSDEPYLRGSSGYERCWQWGSLLREANSSIRFLMADMVLPQSTEPQFLDLRETDWSIIWDVYVGDVDVTGLAPDHTEALLDAGFNLWIVPNDHYDFIDLPGIYPRLLGAFSFLHGASGIEAWATLSWPEASSDPWVDDPSGEFGNGAGAIVYPGRHWNVAGPLPSLRLELNREAFEDHALLWLVDSLGASAFARDVARNLVPSDYYSLADNGVNSTRVQAARLALAGEVLRRAGSPQLSDPNLASLAGSLPDGFGQAPGTILGNVTVGGNPASLLVSDGLAAAPVEVDGSFNLTTLPGTRQLTAYRPHRQKLSYLGPVAEAGVAKTTALLAAGGTASGASMAVGSSGRHVVLVDGFEGGIDAWTMDGPGTVENVTTVPGTTPTEGSTALKLVYPPSGEPEVTVGFNFTGQVGSPGDELWLDVYAGTPSTYTVTVLAFGEAWEYSPLVYLAPGGWFTITIPLDLVEGALGRDLASAPVPFTFIVDNTVGEPPETSGQRVVYLDAIRLALTGTGGATLVPFEGGGGDEIPAFPSLPLAGAALAGVSAAVGLGTRRRKHYL
ncbi:MAG: hypothetical protein Kow0069_04360 [Promethearchaeota archaeon]